MTDESTDSRLGKLETHAEYHRAKLNELEGKVDQLVARPDLAGFVVKHWRVLLVVTLTLTGAGWAAPILAALK